MPTLTKVTAAQLWDELRAVVRDGELRNGSPSDDVCGVTPRFHVTPADDVELARVLECANRLGLRVSPRGSGTKLEWGTAPNAIDLTISTAKLNRIIEHAPGDMTVIVEAGATIAQLQSALCLHGQRVALDPLWPESATVGGVIATNDSGALRLRYGAIRDLIIGITVVLCDGTIARSGGKVVKNVAGYDLPKLMSGALGTLGIITSATFRLHPLPVESRTVSYSFTDCKLANDFMLAIVDSTVVTSGLQMRTSSADATIVDVRIDGIAAGVSSQTEVVRKLAGKGMPATPDASPWQARQQLWDGADAAIVKLSMLPSEISSTEEFLRNALGQRAKWNLLAYSTGLSWLRVDADDLTVADFISSIRNRFAPSGGSAVLLKASPSLRQKVDVWGSAGSSLPVMKRIKEQFDPRAILNRGRFIGGI